VIAQLNRRLRWQMLQFFNLRYCYFILASVWTSFIYSHVFLCIDIAASDHVIPIFVYATDTFSDSYAFHRPNSLILSIFVIIGIYVIYVNHIGETPQFSILLQVPMVKLIQNIMQPKLGQPY